MDGIAYMQSAAIALQACGMTGLLGPGPSVLLFVPRSIGNVKTSQLVGMAHEKNGKTTGRRIDFTSWKAPL
jgi:hypothetical protein